MARDIIAKEVISLFCTRTILKQEMYYRITYYSFEELKEAVEKIYKILQREKNKRETWVEESDAISAQYLGCIKIA